MTDKNFKHWIWAMVILACVVTICITIDDIAKHPYTIRFEIDNNTLEAVKSVNWTEIPSLRDNYEQNDSINIHNIIRDYEAQRCCYHSCNNYSCTDSINPGTYDSNIKYLNNVTGKIE